MPAQRIAPAAVPADRNRREIHPVLIPDDQSVIFQKLQQAVGAALSPRRIGDRFASALYAERVSVRIAEEILLHKSL